MNLQSSTRNTFTIGSQLFHTCLKINRLHQIAGYPGRSRCIHQVSEDKDVCNSRYTRNMDDLMVEKIIYVKGRPTVDNKAANY